MILICSGCSNRRWDILLCLLSKFNVFISNPRPAFSVLSLVFNEVYLRCGVRHVSTCIEEQATLCWEEKMRKDLKLISCGCCAACSSMCDRRQFFFDRCRVCCSYRDCCIFNKWIAMNRSCFIDTRYITFNFESNCRRCVIRDNIIESLRDALKILYCPYSIFISRRVVHIAC